jgi:hypothetical protein
VVTYEFLISPHSSSPHSHFKMAAPVLDIQHIRLRGDCEELMAMREYVRLEAGWVRRLMRPGDFKIHRRNEENNSVEWEWRTEIEFVVHQLVEGFIEAKARFPRIIDWKLFEYEDEDPEFYREENETEEEEEEEEEEEAEPEEEDMEPEEEEEEEEEYSPYQEGEVEEEWEEWEPNDTDEEREEPEIVVTEDEVMFLEEVQPPRQYSVYRNAQGKVISRPICTVRPILHRFW